jgi:hypothetical protein
MGTPVISIEIWQRSKKLTLVLKASTNYLENSIFYFCGLMHDVEILPASLSYNSRIALVCVQISSNILPQLLEYKCAASKVQSREVVIGYSLSHDVSGRSGDKLNDPGGYARFFEYFVDKVVRVCGSG